jgi:SAM-dependent methyltransferase
MAGYDQAFYSELARTARRSARSIVPVVLAHVPAKSVIDIGCGTGIWLSVFAVHGIADFVGVDGHFFAAHTIEIPVERYVSFDLTRPYACARRFDLVVSLEVAEHLPPDCAEALVASLVRLGLAVLFSAAIPGQGGTHHVNERWQDYWAGLFNEHDYVPVDCIRKAVWDNPEVAWWYAQNTILYCARSHAAATPALAREIERSSGLPLNIVHPRKLEEAVWRERLARAAVELARVVPAGTPFLLIDGATSGNVFDVCGQALPFPQQDGVFAGPPADSRNAIAELRACSPSGRHVVITEPAFWWLSYYSEWSEELKANSRLVLETEMMKVFELTGRRAGKP